MPDPAWGLVPSVFYTVFNKTSFFAVFSRFFALRIKQYGWQHLIYRYEEVTYTCRRRLLLCQHGGEQQGAALLVLAGKSAF
jgi:hypothetical protein